MQPESLKYLYDVMQATGIIAKVCSTQTYQSFADDVVIGRLLDEGEAA